jgi:hypothetical protein
MDAISNNTTLIYKSDILIYADIANIRIHISMYTHTWRYSTVTWNAVNKGAHSEQPKMLLSSLHNALNE